MTLGEHIVELRNTRGISQAELAEAMEVSRQSVSKWETNASVPDLDKLVKLADYFQLTLDQLVIGRESEAQPLPRQEAPTPPARRSRAQSIGLFCLCLSAFAAILMAILFGIVGMLFVLPILLFGLICCFAPKHPILKAVWADYILLSAFAHLSTGIQPSHILWTFRWTDSMNYSILVFSWIWFLIIVALIVGTAFVFRSAGWSWTPKQITQLVLGPVLYALGFLWGAITNNFGLPYVLYLLQPYLQLAGLTLLAVSVTRWLWSLRAASNP